MISSHSPKKTEQASAELELLLYCAKYQTPKTIQYIRALCQTEINWPCVFDMAFRHGLLPILNQKLREHCPSLLADSLLHDLQQLHTANTLRNASLTDELIKIVKLFQQHHIVALSFKGPVLAVSAYGDVTLRQISDLDILVKASHYVKAKALLVEHGHHMSHDSKQEARTLQAQLWHEKKGISIDLHFGIPPNYLRLDTNPLFTSIGTVNLHGTQVPTLTPSAHLVILCINIFKENWHSLGKLCDVANLANAHPQLDWQQVNELARQLNVKRIVHLTLLLVNEFLSKEATQKISSNFKHSSTINWIAKQLAQQIFAERNFQHTRYLTANFLAKLFICGLRPNRILFFIRPNELDRDYIPLPNFLAFLYYFIRPIRLTGNLLFNTKRMSHNAKT